MERSLLSLQCQHKTSTLLIYEVQHKQTHWVMNARKANNLATHNAQTYKLRNSKNYKLINLQTHQLINLQTQKLTNSSTCKLKNSQTDKHINSRTYKLINSKTQIVIFYFTTPRKFSLRSSEKMGQKVGK